MTRWKGTTVAVLYGGESREREISLTTGRAIADALDRCGYDVARVDWKGDRAAVLDLLNMLAQGRVGVVFNALHGGSGESGPVQGFLELCGVPYTGSGVLASALAMDKARSKLLARAAGLETAPWVVWSRAQAEAFAANDAESPASASIPSPPGLPLVVKPTLDGSSVGVSLVREASEFGPALEAAMVGKGEILIEKLIEGPEVSVAVLNGKALGVCEIKPQLAFYTYEAKYQRNDTRYLIPTSLGEDIEANLRAAAERIYAAVGCEGVARVDFMVEQGKHPMFLELNTMPGMTPTSLVPKIAASLGITFDALVEQMLGGAHP